MDKKIVMKIFKKSAKTIDKKSRIIVITYNTGKVNGGYRFDKIGVIKIYKNMKFCYLNLYKLGYWLNRGCLMKSKVSWFIGLLGAYEAKMK